MVNFVKIRWTFFVRFLHHRDEGNLDGPLTDLLLGGEVALQDLLLLDKKKQKQKQKLNASVKGEYSLAAPLTTPQQERVERSALYQRVQEEVRSWDPVVHARRSAQQVKFPLEKADMRLTTSKQNSASFKVRKGRSRVLLRPPLDSRDPGPELISS